MRCIRNILSKKANKYIFQTIMGLPWYRVHTVVLNDPGRLILNPTRFTNGFLEKNVVCCRRAAEILPFSLAASVMDALGRAARAS